MAYMRTNYTDAITDYLNTLISNQLEEMRILWKDYEQPNVPDGKGRLPQVFIDLQEQLIYLPAIEILAEDVENSIFSIGTQEEKGNYSIITTIANNHPEYSSKYSRIFGTAIFDVLNDFNNRSFKVPGYDFKAYYSEATNIEYGYRRGKGLRSTKTTWFYKLLKPNRTNYN